MSGSLDLEPDAGPGYRSTYSSHCLRVGTCTALNKLGLSKEQIELWLGWTAKDMFG